MRTVDVSDVTTRDWDIRRCCWFEVTSCTSTCILSMFDCKRVFVYVYTALQCVYLHVCVYVNWGTVNGGQEHLKKSTQTSALPSVQGATFHPKESFGGKKEINRKKETDFKTFSKERQTWDSLLFFLFFGFFLSSYRKEQNDCGVQLQVKGVETG